MGGEGSGRKPNPENLFKRQQPILTPIGHTKKDGLFLPNHSGDNSAGTVLTTPVNDFDIPNKSYVDSQVSLSGGDNLGNHIATQTVSGGDIHLSGAAVIGSTFEVSGANFEVDAGGDVSIGGNGVGRKLNIVDSVNPQFRITHSEGNYVDFQANSLGNYTITPIGGAVDFAATLLVDGNFSVDSINEAIGTFQSTNNYPSLQIKGLNVNSHPFISFRKSTGAQIGAIGVDEANDFLTFGVASINNDYMTINRKGEVRIGNSSRNVTYDNSGGALYTGDSSGLIHGEVSFIDNTSETVIATQNVPVPVSGGWATGLSSRTTPSTVVDGSAKIKIQKAGRYLVTASTTVESVSGGGSTLSLDVSGASVYTNLHCHRALAGGGGDVGSTSISGIVDLAADEELYLTIKNTTGTENYVVEDCTFSAIQIGGT